jgi:small-conductance mechanosensitive channel
MATKATRHRVTVWACILGVAWQWACGPILAQENPPPNTQALSSDDARQFLSILEDERRRAQLIQTLRAIAASPHPAQEQIPAAEANPSPAPPGQPSGPGPTAESKTTKPAAQPPATLRLEPNGLGAQLLTRLAGLTRGVVVHVDRRLHTATQYWRAGSWRTDWIDNPAAVARLWDIAWRVLAILACAAASEWLTRLVVSRPRSALARDAWAGSEPEPDAAGHEGPLVTRRPVDLRLIAHALARLPAVLARLLLDLLSVLAFAAVGNVLAGTSLAGSEESRVIALALVDAYALCRATMYLIRALAGSPASGPRLLTVKESTAAYLERWSRRIVVVTVFGIAAADAALLLGIDVGTYHLLVTLVALIGHILAALVIIQCRRPVAAFIRGPDGAAAPAVQRFREQLARVWHVIAVVLDFAIWAVGALDVPGGYAFLVRSLFVTAIVLIAARLLIVALGGGLDRLLGAGQETPEAVAGLRTRMLTYHSALRGLLSTMIFLVVAVALLEIWGVDALAWFRRGGLGGRLLFALLTIAVSAFVAVLAWQIANVGIERRLARLASSENPATALRLRTLLPLFRGVLLAVILIVVGLTALSQLGVTIAPLLASAGIVGVAVGVGSQKLIQDFITGLFLLVENGMQVGEWVTAGGVSGSVERLTFRTMQLRGGDGALHIVPYSSVATMSNASRGTGIVPVSVSVSYRENTDRVGAVLKEIAEDMRREPHFAVMMRSDLQLWGVDRIDGTTATIVGQIVCTDAGRWPVQRELNRRIKLRFDALGIEIAIPPQGVVLRQLPANAAAPPPREPPS